MNKKLKIGFIAGIFLFCMVGISHADTVLFQDNFNTGVMSSEWVSIRGNQWVQNGVLYNQNPVFGAYRDSEALVHDGDMNWTDYTISVKIDPIETFVTDTTILFRTDGFDRSSGGTYGQGYQFGISTADHPPYILLWQTSNLLYSSPFSIPTGPMDIVISAIGPNIKVWIDGSLMIDVVDPNPLLYGGIGVHNVWESIGTYDDFVVTSVTTPEPVPEPTSLVLLATGLAGIGIAAWCRRKA
jgi:hypothetical protein